MTIAEMLGLIRDGGILFLLVVAIVGGFQGWYVWRWQYEQLRLERDEWKRIALKGLNLAERVIS